MNTETMISILREEFLRLITKWSTYKRIGSTPHSIEYEKDAKRRREIAAQLDLLIHGKENCICGGGTVHKEMAV